MNADVADDDDSIMRLLDRLTFEVFMECIDLAEPSSVYDTGVLPAEAIHREAADHASISFQLNPKSSLRT